MSGWLLSIVILLLKLDRSRPGSDEPAMGPTVRALVGFSHSVHCVCISLVICVSTNLFRTTHHVGKIQTGMKKASNLDFDKTRWSLSVIVQVLSLSFQFILCFSGACSNAKQSCNSRMTTNYLPHMNPKHSVSSFDLWVIQPCSRGASR